MELRRHPSPGDAAQFINYPYSTMRERYAVQSILTKVLLKARQSNASQVKSLQIALGEISELEQTAVRQFWEELSQGTPAERAQLHFRFINAELQCIACFEKYHPVDKRIHCPYC